MATIRRSWRLLVGLVVSGLFLYWALGNQQPDQVWHEIRRARYLWLLPGVAVYFLAVVARTWRWHYLLRPLKSVPLGSLFPIVTIGYMGNNIYPARAGEVLRAYVLKRTNGVSISASLATVVIERVFDGLTMLLFVVLALPLVGTGLGFGRLLVYASALFLGALLAFLGMAVWPLRTQAAYTWLVHVLLPARWHSPVLERLSRFMGGLESLRSVRDVAMILGTSVVVWLFETFKYWFVAHAFDLKVSFFTLMLMNGVVNLFTTLPALPGHVGTFDAPGIKILEAVGVSGDVATAYTLVLHAALWLPITVLGAFYLGRLHLGWGGIRAEMQREELTLQPGAARLTSGGPGNAASGVRLAAAGGSSSGSATATVDSPGGT
jgi:hypothetical protein